MATTTTKRGLRKPGRSDYINVVTDINNNMDNLDDAVPDSRKVNGKALSSDVTIDDTDLPIIAGKIASTQAMIAPPFVEATPNDAGSYVTNAGALYFLPNGHTANTTWANTSKTAVDIDSVIAALKESIADKQDPLTFDSTPTQNSTNPVTSGGVYSAIKAVEVEDSALSKIADSDAEDVDLDITDNNGNVIARFADGHIEVKEFDSRDVGDLGDLETTDKTSLVDAINEVNGAVDDKIDMPTGGTAGQVLGLDSNLDPAWINQSGGGGSGNVDTLDTNSTGVDLDIADKNGNVLLRMSDGHIRTKNFDSKNAIDTKSTKNVDADLDITDQYGNVLVRFANGGLRTKKYSIEDMNAVISDIVDYIGYHLDNRLANPIFETLEHYNQEHSSAQINVAQALIKGVVTSDMTGYRIPSMCITNSGTFLVSAQRMVNTSGDTGDLSIDVARKTTNGNWAASVVVPFDSTRESYGNAYNDEFLVDRNTGRIYLFFGTIMQKEEWIAADGADCDFRYVYSDDDGETWSSPVSLKYLWDTDTYDYCIPACTKGIVLTDGTLLVPCMAKRGTSYATGQSYSLLLIKPPSGDWYLSSVAYVDGLKISDECAVVEGLNENEIWLYSRPQTNYGTGVNRGYNKFIYDIATDTFTHQRSTFDCNRKNAFSIDKITISNQVIYLMTFTDTNGDAREKTTLWASLDGDTWIRVYRINKPESAGYSVIDNYSGTIAVAYEARSVNGTCIEFQDISNLYALIYDSATEYIVKNISIQDRLQMIFNYANGLD